MIRHSGWLVLLLCAALGATAGNWLLSRGDVPVPLPTASTTGHETAWRPYVQRDGAVYSVCISSRSGMILPPYINPDVTPAPALASNPPINQAL